VPAKNNNLAAYIIRPSNIMSNQNIVSTTIDWEDVILALQAFTRSWVNGKGWFRGKYTTSLLKGKEIDDYVYGAIEKYLRYPEKHDPSKGTLIDYLKYNLVRSMVSNDLVSAENRTSQDILTFAEVNAQNDEDNGNYIDSILPHAEVYFDQEIDYNVIMSSIETEVKGDKILEEIFLGVCSFNLKRREIIEEFGMKENDFDNGMRRLKTILKSTINKYDLKQQPL